jgi:hypothetical protein
MHDKIRQMIIKKMVLRANIARNMLGNIIPAVTNHLNAKPRLLRTMRKYASQKRKLSASQNASSS